MKAIFEVNENELLALGGIAVDAALHIKELNDYIKSLESKIKSEPVCPFCKEVMEPINFSHYYSEGSFAVWFCGFENARKVHRRRVGSPIPLWVG